ncbi:MAG: DNA mismatch repair protein MutS [Myxococcales bacterium]|jgi:DNA mismatch repair protein MutS|nr:DNA mismatch repair protein MutS [Myxococcales bacterium]
MATVGEGGPGKEPLDLEKLTPMMRQYQQVKARLPDAILMFRLGDFFEMFFDDAVKAAEILQITLTARGTKGKEKTPIPMCGVPYHSVKNYIARLVEVGLKVALCDQVELPAKGIARREVTRIVTPGMVIDDDLIDTRANNFLCAVLLGPEAGGGLALIDASTGDFQTTQVLTDEALRAELLRSNARELIVPESQKADARIVALAKSLPSISLSSAAEHSFDPDCAERSLCSHFGTKGLDGFGLSGLTLAIGAAGAALAYLKETQQADAAHVDRLSRLDAAQALVLDEATRTNLELFRTLRENKRKGSLLGLIDKCATTMGSRQLTRWLDQPLLDLTALEQRLDAVEELFERTILREQIADGLRQIADLDRLVAKLSLGQGTARELRALAGSLLALPALKARVDGAQAELLQSLARPLIGLEDLAEHLDRAVVPEPPLTLKEGGIIREGYDAALDKLVAISTRGKDFLLKLELEERERTGIQSLKVRYNRVFGYYIEITKANLHLVPRDYIRKQTTVGGERFITQALKEYEEQVLDAEERRVALETKIFEDLRAKVMASAAALKAAGRSIAELDALQSLARVAALSGYVRPTLDDGEVIDIREGRHPVIERLLEGEAFVPNDVKLDCANEQLIVITGPNMAGKSTVMRQTALIVLMAQMGSFVPAKSARIGLVDRLFTRVGAADNLARGQSTFMVEMVETAAILHRATRRSLILLDEIGRGTSTFDGLSIAWAVAEQIHEKIGARTLFATHYHELTDLSRECPRVKNTSIAVRELGERVVFLRKLIDGGASRSYGIEVARLAGLPPEVIARARELLANLERQELDDAGRPSLMRSKKVRAATSQLSLFGGVRPMPAQPPIPSSHQKAIDILKAVDPSRTTPMDALLLLARLKETIEA